MYFKKTQTTQLNMGLSYLIFKEIWKQQASYWHMPWIDMQGACTYGETLALLYPFSSCHKHSTQPSSPISEKWQRKKTSYQQSLSSKTVVTNIFIFNVSTDFSEINSALETLIYCSDNFSSYEPWHVNKCSSKNSHSVYLHNAVYLTKVTFSSYSMKDHPSVVTGLGAGRVRRSFARRLPITVTKAFSKNTVFFKLTSYLYSSCTLCLNLNLEYFSIVSFTFPRKHTDCLQSSSWLP